MGLSFVVLFQVPGWAVAAGQQCNPQVLEPQEVRRLMLSVPIDWTYQGYMFMREVFMERLVRVHTD